MTESPEPTARARRANIITLALVAGAFLGTPLLAALWYAYGDAGRGARVNHGTLIDPPRAVAGARELGLYDRWTLVVSAEGACDAACAEALVLLRQVRLTFGADADRIALLLVSGAADADRTALAPQHPDLRVVARADASALLDAVAPAADGEGVVVDPLGNAMLRFAPGAAPADVKADLKRLLEASRPWLPR